MEHVAGMMELVLPSNYEFLKCVTSVVCADLRLLLLREAAEVLTKGTQGWEGSANAEQCLCTR